MKHPPKPSHLRAFGHDWTIQFNEAHDALEPHFNGVTRYADLAIIIRNNILAKEKQVLLHEVIHIVSTSMGMDLEEKQVEQLENGLWAVFADNPEVTRWMLG